MINFNEAYNRSLSLLFEPDNEYISVVEDLIKNEKVLSMKIYPQHADIDRLQHMIAVSYISFLVCKELNLDYVAAARAGLLHDLVYYDWHDSNDGMNHRLHGYRHPAFALKNAKELTPLSKLEENIILRHMWPLTPTPPAYKESFVVTFADKYCATRETLRNLNKNKRK